MKKIQFLLIATLALMVFASCKSDNKPTNKLTELTEQIEKNPNEAEGYYLRGQYYYEKGFIEKGFDDAAQAVKLDDDNTDYYVLLSDFYFAQRETDLVEETLQKAIALDNKNNEARMKLAELYFHLSMIKECNETLDAAIHEQPHNPRAHLIRAFCYKETGDTTNMLRILQLCVDQDPSEKKAFLELGFYYQQQLNPIAIQYYQNALALDANDIEINYNLAKLYQDLGMADLAKAQYQHLLQIKPDSYGALNGLGYIALEYENNSQEAIGYFTRAIEIDSLYPMAVGNRGLAFESLGMIEEARQDYMYCKKLDPSYPAAIDGLNRLNQ